MPCDGRPAVVCRGLRKTFPTPVRAVEDVSFDVQRGEIFGILGPNGSGKSTLVRLLATLLLPDAGSAEVFGYDVVRERFAVRRLINRVSVEASFFKRLSSMENLRYAARLYGLEPREATRRALEVLERLGFDRRKAYGPLEELSRGMQQKVAVARALFTSPVLLLLDEPTTGLDPRSKREVQDFVLETRSTHDTTVLLTSHDMVEADRLCDRVAFIDGGRLVALGSPADLKRRFAHLRPDGRVTLEDIFLEVTGKEWPGEEDADGD